MSAPAVKCYVSNCSVGQTRRREGHTGKGLLATGDNYGSDVLVCFVFVQGIVELSNEGGGEGIEGLGTVQSDWIPC